MPTIAQERFISWAKRQSPNVWHAATGNLNWDEAMPIIDWIVSQPACDRATAQRIFFLCNPDWWLQYPDRKAVEDWQIEGFDLCSALVQRWNSGFYSNTHIQSDPDVANAWSIYCSTEDEDRTNGLPWIVDRNMGDVLNGSVVENMKLSSSHEVRALFDDLGAWTEFSSPAEEAEYRAWRSANGFDVG